ncbi:MAG: LysR family transcriptional regulator [Solobacterium sp.]|nr:LysR family transcriptional regulator [Solobacterium sp.]
MELRSLRYFMAIAKEQNMTNAASVLHISQPALSYQIAELEKEAGCLLFERTGRKMVLTEEGIKLLSRAERILELADKITDDLQDTGNEIKGDVYIGAAESPRIHLIAEAIASLQKQYPDIRYHFYSGNLDDVYGRLSRGDLDFAVMIEPFGFESCETIFLPEGDTEGVLIRKDHPLAGHQAITAEDLKDLPLLINSRSNFTIEDFARHFSIPAEQLKIAGSGNLVYNKAILAEHGIGAAVTLKDLVSCDENSQLVFLPFDPPIEKQLVFAWKKYRPLSSAAAALLREVQEQIRKQ